MPKLVKSVDDLAWERCEQDLPKDERLEADDGIFYGLEEIDGVGVDTSQGIVSFLVKSQNKIKGQKKNGAPKNENKAENGNNSKKQKLEVLSFKQNDNQEPTFQESDLDEGFQESDLTGSDFGGFSSNEEPDEPDEPEETPQNKPNDWPVSKQLEKSLIKLGFMTPTLIQKESIPVILQGKDVMGKASTGSGKTLAYGLPLLESFLKNDKAIQGIIVAPTRELAHQIRDHMNAVIEKCDAPAFKKSSGVVALTGGLAIQKQLRLLSKNPAVIVGTPGRLLEILEQLDTEDLIAYKQVPSLVLDEADRLVQANSFEELDKILGLIGNKHQTLVFSATFEADLWSRLDKKRKRNDTKQDIRAILQKKLRLSKHAVFLDADPKSTVAENVKQSIIECPAMDKDLYLYYFAFTFPGKTMVFVNSIDSVKRLVPLLKELGVQATGVHSDMIQKQRLRSIDRFKEWSTCVLVCTDVAARGLDIPLVDHVVHYHLPRTADTYVHRSGRTARAGNVGIALMLCSPQEASEGLAKLKKLCQFKPQVLDVDFDILERLRPRVSLGAEIAKAVLSSTKRGKSGSWLEKAADDLGVDLDDDEMDKLMGKAKSLSNKDDVKEMRAKLERLLSQKIVPSRKYLTGGSVNIARELLKNPQAALLGRPMRSVLETLKK